MNNSVLIVDDSLTVRMDLAEAFESGGFHTYSCATIAEARQLLADTEFGVVVLDVVLPDGDGVEFLQELRASPATATVAILMLSTETEVKHRIRGLQRGADEYVGKPYEHGYVVARARELAGRHRADGDSSSRPRILVIDDSVTFREVFRDALEAAGYSVTTATSGEEGLRLAADWHPHAIIVDGVLPGIDGASVIRRVRLDAALRRVQCILLTGSEDRGAELRALDAGADTFAHKDEGMDIILARVTAILRRGPLEPTSDSTPSLLAPKRILAVDDSPTYLHEVAAALRTEGYDVVLAQSGQEAIELLAVQPVDCVLLDVIMPGLSGHETCRRIKATPFVGDVPVIMLTAMEDRSAMIEGLSAGADDYISKSSEFDVLGARVRAQIRRKQSEDENRRIREELHRRDFEMVEARAARQLAETRAALVTELQAVNKELESFSYSVSHDLRAPLRHIAGFSACLEEDHSAQLDASGRQYLQKIRAATQRMGRLIDDLLNLSRISRTELRRHSVDLSLLATDVVSNLRQSNPDREVSVSIQHSLTAHADPGLLRVVLQNLLDNAWKFTARQQIGEISFGADKVEGRTAYYVRDNGAGFDPRYADKLFGAFERLHPTEEFDGTGIGLATVQRVVHRHGGRVWADGQPGAGATFWFTIEAGPDDKEPLCASQSPA